MQGGNETSMYNLYTRRQVFVNNGQDILQECNQELFVENIVTLYNIFTNWKW